MDGWNLEQNAAGRICFSHWYKFLLNSDFGANVPNFIFGISS